MKDQDLLLATELYTYRKLPFYLWDRDTRQKLLQITIF